MADTGRDRAGGPMITAEMVNRVLNFHRNGLPVVFLYGCIGPGVSTWESHARMMSLLDQVHPLAKDEALEHQVRLSVRGDNEGIKDAIDSQRWLPGAVAIFSCCGRDLYEEVPLRGQLREQVIVDATPFARPMLSVLSEYHRACILVINKASARVWEVDPDEMREVGAIKDRVLRKPLRGWAVPLVMPVAQSWQSFNPDDRLTDEAVAAQLRARGAEVVHAARQFQAEGTCN